MPNLKATLKEISSPQFAANQIMPIWLLNDKIDPIVVETQLTEMKQQGIQNVAIKAERGVLPSYMSHDYIVHFDSILKIAKKHSISCYLCDDLQTGHPGVSAGITEKHEEMRLQYLSLHEVVKTKGPKKHVQELSPAYKWSIIGFKMKEKGIDSASIKNLSSQVKNGIFSWTVTNGDWRILFFRTVACKRPVGGWVIDTMNHEAAKAYIEAAYSRLRNGLTKEGAVALKGVLVELPYVGPDTTLRGLPWSDNISKLLQTATKADFLSQLMALFVEGGAKNAGVIRREYYSLLLKLQCQNFLKPIQEYCTKSKLQLMAYTASSDPYGGEGQLRYDYSPIVQKCTAIQGISSCDQSVSSASLSRFFADLRGYYNRSRGSAILGRNRTGIGLGLKELKYESDLYAINGIEGNLIDGSYYALRYQGGMRAPANVFVHHPSYSQYGIMLKTFQRRMALLSGLHAHEQVGVVFPSESFYASYNPISPTNYKAKIQHFDELMTYLEKENLSFQFINEELAGQMTISNKGQLALNIGGKIKASFSVLILPEMAVTPKKFIPLLEKFVMNGGKVVFYGITPFETTDGVKDADLMRTLENLSLKKSGSVLKFTRPEELDTLRTGGLSGIVPQIEFFSEAQIEKRIFCRSYSEGGTTVHLMLNTSNDNVRTEIKVTSKDKAYMYWLDLTSGALNTLPASESNGTLKPFIYSFAPKEGAALLVSKEKLSSQPNSALALDDPSRLYRIILKDQWEYEVLDENVLPVTSWSMKINSNRDVNSGYNTSYEGYVQIDSVPAKSTLFLNNLLNRHINGYGSGYFPVEISFNGVLLKQMQFFNRGEKRFRSNETVKKWSHAGIMSYGADVTPHVRKGVNRISIKTYGSTFSPMAIKYPVLFTGKFAVKKGNSGWLVSDYYENIKSGSWTEHGFPFYCGRIVYKQIFEKPDAYKRVMLRFKQIENIATLRVNGNEIPIPPWQPQSVDVSKFIQGEKNRIEIEVSNLQNNLIKMLPSPAGLVGEVYVDVYQ